MKKLYFFLLLTALSLNAAAQEKANDDITSLTELKVHPQYPGPGSFQQYVMTYFKDTDFRYSHKIAVYFIVEKDGSLSNVTFSDGTDRKIKKKVLLALKNSKKWKPGRLNDEVVRVSYTLPIIIKVTNY